MSRLSSKLAGTVVLTLALLSLQGVLWFIRPHPDGKVASSYGYSTVNIHGGNRKLLDVNLSMTAIDHHHVSYTREHF